MARILVVDDEPGIAMALRDDLALEGYEVEVAQDGLSALRVAREGSFDAILLDVMLPGKDGFEICRELRRTGIRTPILITDPQGEQFWPGQSRRLADALPGLAHLVPFTAAEGADRHCEPLARTLLEQRMFDWLDETLGSGRP